MEATNSNEFGYFGNQYLQSKEESGRKRGKINIWKSKHKNFLMSILQKLVIERNIPNCMYLFIRNIKINYITS